MADLYAYLIIISVFIILYFVCKYISRDVEIIQRDIHAEAEELFRINQIEKNKKYRYYEIIDDITNDWVLYVIPEKEFDKNEIEHEGAHADNNCIRHAWRHFCGEGFMFEQSNRRMDLVLSDLEKL